MIREPLLVPLGHPLCDGCVQSNQGFAVQPANGRRVSRRKLFGVEPGRLDVLPLKEPGEVCYQACKQRVTADDRCCAGFRVSLSADQPGAGALDREAAMAQMKALGERLLKDPSEVGQFVERQRGGISDRCGYGCGSDGCGIHGALFVCMRNDSQNRWVRQLISWSQGLGRKSVGTIWPGREEKAIRQVGFFEEASAYWAEKQVRNLKPEMRRNSSLNHPKRVPGPARRNLSCCRCFGKARTHYSIEQPHRQH